MAIRSKLVAGNWKMHGGTLQNRDLLNAVLAATADLSGVELAVCVPYPYLPQAQSILEGTHVSWGAQNVIGHEKGAYTGEISVSMLLDFGCRYVIVGHSERRALYGEDSHTVALKFKAARGAGLIPVLCVGETLEQREAGITEQVVTEQLDAVVKSAGINALGTAVLAYEPVWAIGTGKTANPDQAQEVHSFIRGRIAADAAEVAEGLKILYGGSVKPSNARDLMSQPDVDGALVGGASLEGRTFADIVKNSI